MGTKYKECHLAYSAIDKVSMMEEAPSNNVIRVTWPVDTIWHPALE